MKFEGFSSIRFLIGLLVGVGLIVWFGGISLSKNISERVEKARVLVSEMQQMENPDLEKMNEILRVTVISGVRG